MASDTPINDYTVYAERVGPTETHRHSFNKYECTIDQELAVTAA